MADIQKLTSRIELANRRAFLLTVTIGYSVLAMAAFAVLSVFLQSFLAAIVSSHGFAIATQEWRTVLNGVSSGWRFFPPLEGLCISIGDNIVATHGHCPEFNAILSRLSGQVAVIEANGIDVRVSIKYSIWLWALIAPVLAFMPVVLAYQALKKPLSNRIHLHLLEQLHLQTARSDGSDLEELARLQMNEIVTLRNQSALAQLASQVAHDIRSPLAALATITRDLAPLPEDSRIMIRNAVNRITDIANDLIEKHREIKTNANPTTLSAEEATVQLLSVSIGSVITEKRMQYRAKIGIRIEEQIDTESYGLFAKVQPTELKRVLSNLINNAVEALDESGTVTLRMRRSKIGTIQIAITDNGKGIPASLMGRMGEQGISHGKAGGSGLGLYHAKSRIESWGGNLHIKSKEQAGTTVELHLPSAPPPSWFIQELWLRPRMKVVILDDDSSTHAIWQARFESMQAAEHEIEILHLSTPDQLTVWIQEARSTPAQVIFLIDHEIIGHQTTGLQLIRTHAIGGRSVLVTSHFEEKELINECERSGVKLLPKAFAGFIPIQVKTGEHAAYNAVLIDDDDLVHLTWNHAAKKAGMTLLAFRSPELFFAQVSQIDRDTPIYIDSQLGKDGDGHDIKGEEISRTIRDLGFKNLFLTTGLSPQHLPHLPWIAAVRGKEPPFGENKT